LRERDARRAGAEQRRSGKWRPHGAAAAPTTSALAARRSHRFGAGYVSQSAYSFGWGGIFRAMRLHRFESAFLHKASM